MMHNRNTRMDAMPHRQNRRGVEVLLERLDGVRDRGGRQWYARCPAHNDNSPSLSIKETNDGTVLIHCFAMCSPADIVAAIGIELADLFAEKLEPPKPEPNMNTSTPIDA